MYLYIYIYTYKYIYVYIYIYVNVYMSTCKYVKANVSAASPFALELGIWAVVAGASCGHLGTFLECLGVLLKCLRPFRIRFFHTSQRLGRLGTSCSCSHDAWCSENVVFVFPRRLGFRKHCFQAATKPGVPKTLFSCSHDAWGAENVVFMFP
jgi:hypothetical protein